MIAIGIAGGLIFFVPAILIYLIPKVKARKALYLVYLAFLAIFLPIFTEKIGIPESKYLMIVVSSYLIAKINRKRDEELPRFVMSKVWSLGVIFVYGTLGA